MYRLMIKWQDGRVTEQKRSYNPTEAREAEKTVSRNPKAIARIELWDGTGSLETIWAATWETPDLPLAFQPFR